MLAMLWKLVVGALGLCLAGAVTLVAGRAAYVRICRLRGRPPAPSRLVPPGSGRRRVLSRAPYATLVGGLELAIVFLVWVVFLRPGPISGNLAPARSTRPGLRVLLIGNSLIRANDLGSMVHDLGRGDPGGPPPLYVVQYAVNGATLSQSEQDPALQKLLTSVSWNDVVLQENSNVADDPPLAQSLELPAVQSLMGHAAHTILFEPWPHQGGDPRYPGDTTWLMPTVTGSYLAACQLFADVTGYNPARSSYTAGLSEPMAHRLGNIAWETFASYRPPR